MRLKGTPLRPTVATLAITSAALWLGLGASVAGGSGGSDERNICPPTPPRHTCPGEVDVTPPETKFLLAPGGPTRNRTATFQFLATESSTFICNLDGRKEIYPCTSPLTLRVTRKRHTLEVTAIDASGNMDPTPARATWLVKKRR